MSRLLLLALVTALFPSSAGASDCYKNFLKLQLSEHKSGVLTKTDESKIIALLDDPDLSEKEKARQVFEAVLEARIRTLPAAQKEKVLGFYKDYRPRLSKASLSGTFTALGKGFLDVVVPARYRGTLLEYRILVHELEHALQQAPFADEPALSGVFRQLLNGIEGKFLEEEGAMRAEWLYLNRLGPKLRAAITREVKSDPNLTSGHRRFILRNLANAQKTADEYIKLEHEAGRYSYGRIAAVEWSMRLMVGAGAVGLPLYSYCSSRSCEIKSEAFKYLCAENPLLKSSVAEWVRSCE